MAIAYKSFAEAKNPFLVTDITINKPSGVVENDLIVAVICLSGNGTVSSPAGWNGIQSSNTSAVSIATFYKVAGASEGASYLFTYSSGNEQAYGFIIRFDGEDTTTPINISGMTSGTSATPTCPSVTTTKDGCLILNLFGADDHDVTIDDGEPSGTTVITVDESDNAGDACSGGAAYLTQANAGASGTAAFALTASEEWIAITVGIEPAGAASPSPSPSASASPSASVSPSLSPSASPSPSASVSPSLSPSASLSP